MYLTQQDKDTLVTYLQNAEDCDVFREGYNEGFRRAVNLMSDVINTCESLEYVSVES